MQAAQKQTITSSVNEGRFLEHMRALFSSKTTVLAEVLQNARRAGANAVHLDWDNGNLTVTDNGCGVSDFKAMISVAESGWSEATMISEQPFGIGFFSVSFAAEKVVVESKGRQISFSSEDLIAKQPIPIETSDFIGGTRITLHRCKLESDSIETALHMYAKGFAIPVFWNDIELPRPHALENLTVFDTPVGQLHIPRMAKGTNPIFDCGGTAYCQGLPVTIDKFSTHSWDREQKPILHIDHLRFKVRMPDRDNLIDGADATIQIQACIKGLWKSHLEQKKIEMSSEDFAETFWSVAKNANLASMMNDVPFLPKSALSFVAEYPEESGSDGSSYWSQPASGLDPDDISAGRVQLCKDFDPDSDGQGDHFARLLFAMAKKWLFVEHLPEGHWANEKLCDIGEMPLSISGKILATGQFNGRLADGEVKVFEQLRVTLNGETLLFDEPVALGHSDLGSCRTYLIPHGRNGVGYVLKQASNYYDRHDHYQESDYETDTDHFDDLVAILSGEKPEVTVAKCLESAGALRKTNLFKTSFVVDFDDKGKLTVTMK